ncbi:hypothetical protein Tco_1132785 [Tanacetum coccineum]|uniref:Glutamic acid-rich protein-like n=1 Tax=Tanacetum coccineum TaxID=301880 RepID=A0ABQ5JCW6_9ASTR
MIITETSIRSDLHLEDAGGTDSLPTATIFEELARIGYEKPSQRLTFYKAFFSPQWKFLIHTITQCLSAKTTTWNEFSSTMASAIICLAINQKFNLSMYIFDAMTPITTQPSSSRPQKKQSRRKQRKETKVPQDETHHDDSVPIPSNDPLLSEKRAGAKVDEREVSIGVEDSVAPTILVTTAGEGVTATKIDEITTTSAPTTTIDEITLLKLLLNSMQS